MLLGRPHVVLKACAPVTSLAWLSGLHQSRLAGGTAAGIVAVWDLDGAPSSLSRPPECAIYEATFSLGGVGGVVRAVSACPSDSDLLMACGNSAFCVVWDLRDPMTPLLQMSGPTPGYHRWKADLDWTQTRGGSLFFLA